MAINKRLIHFKNKENFDTEVANGNILDTSIVFIQDTKEISTHGTVYKTVNWSVLEEQATKLAMYTKNEDGSIKNYYLSECSIKNNELAKFYFCTTSDSTPVMSDDITPGDGKDLVIIEELSTDILNINYESSGSEASITYTVESDCINVTDYTYPMLFGMDSAKIIISYPNFNSITIFSDAS